MPSNVLALDVGDKRVGLAIARAEVRVAAALPTLERTNADFWEALTNIISQNDIQQLVVGLPRGLDGQETEQTKKVQQFGQELQINLNLPIIWQDEALTSSTAEDVLNSGKNAYAKGDVDGLAARLILADYLETERIN